jgi:DNA-binding transcriptional regulator/RsmH inhibitor MraZ
VADEIHVTVAKVEKPNGRFPGKLDDKGRLKLPVSLQEYLKSFGEQKFFITSLDRYLAQIYTMPTWRQNEKFFAEFTDDPEVAENIKFNADDLGADAEMDSQGRITFNTDLRRELGLEGQDLHLFAHEGRVEVYSEAAYQARKLRAQQNPGSNVTALKSKGLK